jgi:serine/threonine-protein kinase
MMRLHEILGYEVLGTLGHGARSTIYAVKDKDNNVFALKKVVKTSPSDQRFLDQAISEHGIAQKFNHPTLRKSFRLIRQRAIIRVSEIYVLMEMVDGVTMEQHKPLSMVELVRLCRQVAVGLMEVHKAGFVHADIKPSNILVTDRQSIKIIDFGQSCAIGTIKQRIQGTPDYIAPEQVMRRRIVPQTDVFNLGATLYWLLTGKHIPTLIPKGQPGAVRVGEAPRLTPPKELNPGVTPALSMLVMNCLETDPRQRPETMALVHDRLSLALAQLEREEASAAQRKSAV